MEQLLELLKNIDNIYSNINTIEDLNKLKVEYMGKKGKITELNSLIRTLPNDEKKEFGKKMNELKQAFTSRYDSLKEKLEELKKTSSEKQKVALQKIIDDLKLRQRVIRLKVDKQVHNLKKAFPSVQSEHIKEYLKLKVTELKNKTKE